MADPLADRLTVKHLRLIAAIAEHGQLSLAAHTLSLTQPAASRVLAETERLCGGAVFDRHARGMTPTPLGEALARRARNVLEEISEASREVARLRSGRGGTVRIGAVTGGAVGYVVPVIRALRDIAPSAEVHVEVAMSRELVQDLLSLRLDFVLARIPPDADAGAFEVVRAREEVIDLVAGADHPAAQLREVRLRDLTGYDWVMQNAGAPIRTAIEEALLASGGPGFARVINTSSLLVTIAMLVTSRPVAPVSREVSELLRAIGTRAGIVTLPLRERLVVTPYSLLALRGRRLSPIAQRCHDLVAAALQEQAALR